MNKKTVFVLSTGFFVILVILGVFVYHKYSFKNDQILEIQKEKDLLLNQIFYRDSLMLELNRDVELNVSKLLNDNDSMVDMGKRLFIYIPNGTCFGCIESRLTRLSHSLKSSGFNLTILCHRDNERDIYLFKIKNDLDLNIRNVENEFFEQNIREGLSELTFFVVDRKSNGAIAYTNSGYFDSFKLLASFLKYRY